jgi:putative membrane protein
VNPLEDNDMITNLREHAANERTFLAWVRTAITVIIFGFFVERFDLLLRVYAPVGKTGAGLVRSGFGHVAGLVLIVLGIAMIPVAAVRFMRTAKEIDAAVTHPGTGSRVDLALAVLLVLLAAGLLFYLVNALSVAA